MVRPEQYITNGDFEDTTGWGVAGTTFFPASWTADGIRTNAATIASGSAAIGGSGTSAYLEAHLTANEEERREIRQSFAVPTTNNWQFDVDLAAAPVAFSSEGRSLSFEIEGYEGGKIIARVIDHDTNGIGDLPFYDGDWQSRVPIVSWLREGIACFSPYLRW